MADGTTLSIAVNVLTGSTRHPRLLVVAGHHGDEHEGPAALIKLWENIEPKALSGSLVMVPVLNPPAFQAVRRTSHEDQLDINRVFPGSMSGTVTERLADAFCRHLVPRADLILSMHGWSAGYMVEPYVEYPRLATVTAHSQAAAAAFGLPLINPLDAGPGRLLTVASNLGIPIIEVEIGGQAISLPERRVLYESGTRSLMRHLGMLAGRPRGALSPLAVDRVEVFAPTGGLFRSELAVGSRVRKGQTLARIYDFSFKPLAAVAAPVAGVLGVARLAANVLPGQLLATIFTRARGARNV